MKFKLYYLLVLVMLSASCGRHVCEKGGQQSPPKIKLVKPCEDVIVELSLVRNSELAVKVYNYFRNEKRYEAAYTWITIANKIEKQDGYNEMIKECIEGVASKNNVDAEALAIKYMFKPQKQEGDYYKAYYWVSESFRKKSKKVDQTDLEQSLIMSLQQYLTDDVDTNIAREILDITLDNTQP